MNSRWPFTNITRPVIEQITQHSSFSCSHYYRYSLLFSQFTHRHTHSPGDVWAKTQFSPLTQWREFQFLTTKTDGNMFGHKFHWSGERLSSKRWLSYFQKWSQNLLPSCSPDIIWSQRLVGGGGATVWSSHPHTTRLWLLCCHFKENHWITSCWVWIQQPCWGRAAPPPVVKGLTV